MKRGISQVWLSVMALGLVACTSTPRTDRIPIPDLSNPETRTVIGAVTHNVGNSFTIHDWLVYIPPRLDPDRKHIIMLTGMNGNVISTSYRDSVDEHLKLFSDRRRKFQSLGYILLCPILPRTRVDYPIYFPASDFTLVGRAKVPTDQAVLNTITELRGLLEIRGIKTYGKVLIEGFSAGGIFATRMAFLHPEVVHAIAAGAPGSHTPIPLEEYKGLRLNFPVGAADYKRLFRTEFNLSAYKAVRQFLYIGVEDLKPNNSTLTNPGFLFSDWEITVIRKLFGKDDPEILTNEAMLLQQLGCDVEFKKYQTGHNSSFPEMATDIREYFSRVEKNIGE